MDVMVFNPPTPHPLFSHSPPTQKNKKNVFSTDRQLQRPVLSEEHNAAFPGFLQYIALASVWLCVSAPAGRRLHGADKQSPPCRVAPPAATARWRQPGGGQGTVGDPARRSVPTLKGFSLLSCFLYRYICHFFPSSDLKSELQFLICPPINSPRGDDKENKIKRQTEEKRDGRPTGSMMQRAEGMSHGNALRITQH